MSSADVEAPSKTEADPLVEKNAGAAAVVVENDAQPPVTVMEDAWDIFKLSVPIFLAMLSWVGMKTTDTAILGHVSADALAAAALADLWTMCTAMLIQGRVLGVLVGGAVGAGNPKLAGVYLQVSYLVLSLVAVFVFVAWNFTEAIWVAYGSDRHISSMAGYYSRVLAWSIPGQLAFSQLSQYFSAQRIMYPEANSSSVALILNLILGLVFVLGIPFPNWDGYGFQACPIVTMIVVYLQLLLMWFVYVVIQKLHQTCWGGWSWKEMTWDRIKTFSDLYFPAAFGMASDFWRVAVIGAMAAKLGETEVAVFNTSYRIMWIVLIIVNSLASASGVNMSMRLGNLDSAGARQAGYVGVGLSAIILSVVFLAVASQIRLFGCIFTDDPQFLDMFQETRWPFSITLFFMNLAVAIEKIPYSMGRTTEVFWLGLIASWGAQVPAVYFSITYWRNDLNGLYWGMAIGYFVLVLLYGVIAFTSDWHKYALLARQRSELSDNA